MTCTFSWRAMLVPDFPARCRSPRRAEIRPLFDRNYGRTTLGAVSQISQRNKQPASQRQVFPLYLTASATDRFLQILSSFCMGGTHIGGISELPRTVSGSFEFLPHPSQTIPQTDHSIRKCAATSKAGGDFPKRCGSIQAVLFSFRSPK